jgi:hypothetical protein
MFEFDTPFREAYVIKLESQTESPDFIGTARINISLLHLATAQYLDILSHLCLYSRQELELLIRRSVASLSCSLTNALRLLFNF